MAKIQMGHHSVRLIKFLAENGPRSLAELLKKFPGEAEQPLRSRLRNLEYTWWLQRVGGGTGLAYRVHPDAYAKLPSIGLDIPAPKSKRGRPCDVYVPPPAEVVQPRRSGMWTLGTYTTGFAAPVRAGALDFMACPSRGPI